MLLAASALLSPAQAQPATGADLPPNAIAGELVVKFKKGATDAEIEHGLKLGKLKPKRHLQTEVMHERGDDGLTLTETEDPVNEVVARLKKHPAIEFAEPNLRYQHHATSNDPYVGAGYLWGLYGDAGSPTNGYGSQALEAWNAGHTGTNSVIVAVIDEGIDVAHPELAPNIWKNPYDPADGIDNDGNGYIDDVHGWDFAGNRNIVFDPAGDSHGTHVAGTIGAKGGNGIGIAGVNWDVTIIAGKFLGADGGTTLDAIEAIDYLVGLKKRHSLNLVAINASWGGAGYSQALHDAIIRAAKAGILFIAAAGNEGLNNDLYASYPANLDTRKGTSTETAANYDGVISVAAIDRNGALASFSNYGNGNVDLAAPGVEILSAYPNGYIGYMDGTSMATPHVTGAVALYASTHPGATAQSIRAAILGAATSTTSLAGKCVTGARLNIGSVIAPTPTVFPPLPAPSGLTALAGNANVRLTWNPVTGATSYIVKRSLANSGPYTQLAAGITGTAFTDSSVVNGTTYYYVVAAVGPSSTSPESSPVSALPKAPAPTAPTGLSVSSSLATVVGSSSVSLKWNPVSGAASYKVKRATSPSGPWTLVAAGLVGTSFTQNVTANGAAYFYTVAAANSSGESPDGVSVSVTPASPAPRNLVASALSSNQIQLRWTDQSADEQGFKVEYWSGSSWVQLGIAPSGSTAVSLSGAASRSTYFFRIRAYNGTVHTPYSNQASITTP